MRSRWIWALAVAVALAAAAVAVWSQQEAATKPQGTGKACWGGVVRQLTPEQRERLKSKVRQMRTAGKSLADISAAVQQMLKDWGIQPPAGPLRARVRAKLRECADKLTDEQRQQLRAKAQQLRAEGKSPEEVRAALNEMLKGWGIELPERPMIGRQDKPWRQWADKLTPEQRQELRAKVRQMHEAGKSWREIREAIKEVLKGWGVQAPQTGQA